MSGPAREVALLDVGMGNLRSVQRALARAGAEAELISSAEAVRAADHLVMPGQGAFRDFAKALDGGMGEALREHISKEKPYLGICLGMQALFERSEEAPGAAGLGVFEGEVRRFQLEGQRAEDGSLLKVPHMGWNQVRGRHPFLPEEAWFYFVHSYYCAPADSSLTAGECDYGGPFCAAVAKGRLFACQFHPEKSHRAGESLLRTFLES